MAVSGPGGQSAMFSDGNGGEYRKSLHAYAPPFAQMVESPSEISGRMPG